MAMKQYTFVRFDVSDLDLELAEQDLPTKDDWSFIFEEWVERGYKVSVTTNPENGGVCVSLTGKFTGTADDGHVMAVWSGSIVSSVAKLFYLVDHVGGKIGFVEGQRIADEVHKERMKEIRAKLGMK